MLGQSSVRDKSARERSNERKAHKKDAAYRAENPLTEHFSLKKNAEDLW